MRRFIVACMIWLVGVDVAVAGLGVTVDRTADTYPATPLSGEFTLTPNSDFAVVLGSDDAFQSFCVEAYETVIIGDAYGVYVNDQAVPGGGLRPGEPSSPDGGDLLSPETAYLYTEFRGGTLSGYVYAPGPERIQSALSLQTAIWCLEGEVGYQDLSALSSQAQSFVELAQTVSWATIGDVRVLNLYENGQLRQDMLALVPTSVVPIPGAILLGVLGLGTAGWRLRRYT